MEKKTRDIWVAKDGKIFDTPAECEAHEHFLVERDRRLSDLKLWQIFHNFDGTEGRGYFGKTLVLSDCSQEVIIQYCINTIGQPLMAWYGRYVEAWRLSLVAVPSGESPTEIALLQQDKVPYPYHSPTKLVVVSNNDFSWAGLPVSQFPDH